MSRTFVTPLFDEEAAVLRVFVNVRYRSALAGSAMVRLPEVVLEAAS
jgi:hypothetical protein